MGGEGGREQENGERPYGYKPITNRARERRTKLSTPQILFGGQVYPFGKSLVSYPCCGDTSAVCYSYLTIRLSGAEISSISAVTMPLGGFKMVRLVRRASFIMPNLQSKRNHSVKYKYKDQTL